MQVNLDFIISIVRLVGYNHNTKNKLYNKLINISNLTLSRLFD